MSGACRAPLAQGCDLSFPRGFARKLRWEPRLVFLQASRPALQARDGVFAWCVQAAATKVPDSQDITRIERIGEKWRCCLSAPCRGSRALAHFRAPQALPLPGPAVMARILRLGLPCFVAAPCVSARTVSPPGLTGVPVCAQPSQVLTPISVGWVSTMRSRRAWSPKAWWGRRMQGKRLG